ncbi:iron complex transport system permease protein [Sporobacter termitidis DSM 10068]|uniref:Iron complex transport system permease protein n=1 Tax=Sporobacter termitidis DSM 10068 TaxID=1123282 RepID=A0A1M5UFQ7_9FIRM|nr:iron ABC transporter permease [Sporobacter termitidis]SHH61483.1 iron complex transport system permease protein [Sporobacter termitidis DSM 10068]
MKSRSEGFRPIGYLLFAVVMLAVLILCVIVGSVNIPAKDTMAAIYTAVKNAILGLPISSSIIVSVRLPRVLAVALVGATLSLCGGAIQGLLRNPLADSSTMGVSTGAGVGAVLFLAFGFAVPGLQNAGTMLSAMAFAFISLLLILTLSYKIDYTLSTNTIILIGMIFTMFASSIISLVITFAGDKVNTVVFWLMGSLAAAKYRDVLILIGALLIFGTVILSMSRELNAFAVGEDNARHIGVNVKRAKYVILIAVSALIGVCVSIGGTIGFVGLVVPHMTRMIVGPNHRRLLPACLFSGATFLMLADLLARTLLNPVELPIGVVTSFFGAFAFVFIFYRTRKAK